MKRDAAAKQRNLKKNIVGLSKIYGERAFPDEFIPGKTYIPASGKVIGGAEIANGVEAVLDGWLTEGRWVDKFERKLARFVGVRHASFCSSGSSANLLAISALTSKKLGDRRLVPGDKVVTVAAGFPTTLNPILQNGLVPVFVDVELGSYVPTAEVVREAVEVSGARAIFMAHTLGNPFPSLADVKEYQKQGVWVIEDNCDALGTTFQEKRTGGFGAIATQSFYPAHHITTGEGGATLTRKAELKKIIESFRDWGRDCWCKPGDENTCGKRFEQQLGLLPRGYDHKYVYSHIGYNLKGTDPQAAIGVAQLDRMEHFIKRRDFMFANLHTLFVGHEQWIIVPKRTDESRPCWFGYPITIRDGAPFSRLDFVKYLNEKKIGTRLLFGGNLLRQPAYSDLRYWDYIDGESLRNTEKIAYDTFWIGCWPGIDKPRREYMYDVIMDFFRSY